MQKSTRHKSPCQTTVKHHWGTGDRENWNQRMCWGWCTLHSTLIFIPNSDWNMFGINSYITEETTISPRQIICRLWAWSFQENHLKSTTDASEQITTSCKPLRNWPHSMSQAQRWTTSRGNTTPSNVWLAKPSPRPCIDTGHWWRKWRTNSPQKHGLRYVRSNSSQCWRTWWHGAPGSILKWKRLGVSRWVTKYPLKNTSDGLRNMRTFTTNNRRNRSHPWSRWPPWHHPSTRRKFNETCLSSKTWRATRHGLTRINRSLTPLRTLNDPLRICKSEASTTPLCQWIQHSCHCHKLPNQGLTNHNNHRGGIKGNNGTQPQVNKDRLCLNRNGMSIRNERRKMNLPVLNLRPCPHRQNNHQDPDTTTSIGEGIAEEGSLDERFEASLFTKSKESS